jgi:hypothetical protein
MIILLTVIAIVITGVPLAGVALVTVRSGTTAQQGPGPDSRTRR